MLTAERVKEIEEMDLSLKAPFTLVDKAEKTNDIDINIDILEYD